MLASPIAAREAGIATVFQEFSLVPTLSVAENIFLGRWPRRRGAIDWDAMRSGAREALAAMDVAIDVDALVGDLSVAEQQLVEIAKALESGASMIILDEPTTALGLAEIARLHGLLHRLKERGVAILYISHRLDEVVELVDRVTVLKDGKVVASADRERDLDSLHRRQDGRRCRGPLSEGASATRRGAAARRRTSSRETASPALPSRCAAARSSRIGGVLGSGRTEVARALFGLDQIVSGTIAWKGKDGKVQQSAPGNRGRSRARAGEPQVRRALLQFHRLPEHDSAALGPAWPTTA